MTNRFVLYNALVETMRPGEPLYNSLAVTRGRISAVGNNLAADPEYSRWQKIDLDGAYLIPGFVDAHTHFYYYSQTLDSANLENTQSLDDALSRVKEHCKSLGPRDWLYGFGLDVRDWKEPLWPTANDLDSVTQGKPAFIFTKDYHSAWVNSRALELAGINKHTPDPAGGTIGRLEDGSPAGILSEKSAYMPVYEIIPPKAPSARAKLFERALKRAHSLGVVGTHSFDQWDGFEFMRGLAERKKLVLRICYNVLIEDLDRALAELKTKDLSQFGNEWLRITGVKVFADGALGSRTALMHQPYTGAPQNYGIEVTSKSQLRAFARRARKAGLPLAVHAIGDKAVTNVLETLAQSAPPPGARHRIEHLQTIRKKDLPLLKRSNVVVSAQPSHLPSDIPLIERHLSSRANNCYLFKSLLERNIPLAFGSDVPVEPLDPPGGIADAVRRQSHQNRKLLNPSERITALQAARAFTAGSAFAVCNEHQSGFLLPGYRADLAILSHNLRKATLKSVGDLKVLATIIDGKLVYSAGALDF